MLSDAQSPDRSWRFVLVFDVSRFSRGDLQEAAFFTYQLRELGVQLVYCSEGFTGSDSDDLVWSVKQWQARQFVKDLSRVTIRGQVSHTTAGAWSGGTPPYGFDLEYRDSGGNVYQHVRWMESGDKEVYDPAGKLLRIVQRGERLGASKRDRAMLVPSTPERIAVVRRIFNQYVESGKGMRAIADGLNRDGIPSPRDGNWSSNTRSKWSVGTIRAIIRNPAYRGCLVWNRRTSGRFHKVAAGAAVERPRFEANKPRENPASEWIATEGAHQALVSSATFDRAQELMKARAFKQGPRSFRVGSGHRSPYLFSSLIRCGRCGHAFQGRTSNSRKRRRDGTKIQTCYYACGSFVMKGASTCEKFMIRKEPLEALVLDMIRKRLQALLDGEGERLLRELLDEEVAALGLDPGPEMKEIRARITEIDRKAGLLLDGLSAETKAFIDAKLRDLAVERDRLQRRLEELASLPQETIDADAVLREGLAAIHELPLLMESGSLEERKEFVRAFIDGITVMPDERRLDVRMKKLPTRGVPLPGAASVGMVAGAGFEPATFGL